MYLFADSENLSETPTFRLDSGLTIKQAVRAMIDERAFGALVVDGVDELAVVTVKDLHRAMDVGHSSEVTLYGLVFSKMLEPIFK